jgi:hypothetical protein
MCQDKALYLKPSKCQFCQKQIEYLGMTLDGSMVKPDPSKVEGLSNWPRKLLNVHKVQKVLGVLGYQRQFIPGFAKLAKPLTNLLKKGVKFEWMDETTKALNLLIEKVTTKPVLVHPIPNQKLPFHLTVNASYYVVGATLEQEQWGQKRMIGYFSQALNEMEQRYPIYNKELLAIDQGLEHWRYVLIGEKVNIWTDHKNLEYYRHPQKVNNHVKRIEEWMQAYLYELRHLLGIKN